MRWWKCSLSGRYTGWRYFRRLSTTKVVSRNGTASRIRGSTQRHDRGRLDRRLDGDHPHQQAEQVGPAVAHEALRGREVVDQEAERRARRQGRQHARLGTAEVEGDDRHRGGDDRAHARREAVDAVGEVDDVHHHHQPHHRQQRAAVGDARVGQRDVPEERQRDRLHADAEVDHHDGRQDLAGELQHRVQVEAVVERADERDDRGAEQHAAPQVGFVRRSRAAGRRAPPPARRRRSRGRPSSGVGRSDRPRSRGSSIMPSRRARRIVSGVRSAVTAAATSSA